MHMGKTDLKAYFSANTPLPTVHFKTKTTIAQIYVDDVMSVETLLNIKDNED